MGVGDRGVGGKWMVDEDRLYTTEADIPGTLTTVATSPPRSVRGSWRRFLLACSSVSRFLITSLYLVTPLAAGTCFGQSATDSLFFFPLCSITARSTPSDAYIESPIIRAKSGHLLQNFIHTHWFRQCNGTLLGCRVPANSGNNTAPTSRCIHSL